MVMTPWRQDDGYWESVVSFEAGSQPIAMLRAVRQEDGKYQAVVREAVRGPAERGHMLASSHDGTSLKVAMGKAVEKFTLLCNLTDVHIGP